MKTKFVMKSLLLGLGVSAIALSQAFAANTSLTLGMVLEPPHLDPTAGAAAAIDEVVYANVFEGLTRIDETGTVQPGLAESWTISDDGLTYTFTLRDGATFHDGSAADAADVVYSINRALGEDSENAQKALFEAIDSVSGEGREVTVTLNRPTGDFLFSMGWGDAVIVAEETSAGNKTNPIGTGPFKFSKWVQGDRVELVRNDDYWGDAIALEGATFKFISDPNAAASALMAGDVDGFANFPAPELMSQFEIDPRFSVVIGSTEGETILSTNNGRKPWSDIRVRQAIAHTLDRQSIIDGAMFGYGTPIGTHFAPHNPAYFDELIDTYPRNLEKAKALLAAAGYGDGIEGTLKLPPPSYARRGGEIIAAQLAEVGIDLEIIPVEWGQWLKEVFKGDDFDLTIVSHTEPNDIGIYARDDYYFKYQSSVFNETIDALKTETDPVKRNQLLIKAQSVISHDAVNGFLFQLAKHGVWNSEINGLWANSPVQANDLTGVSWSK